MKNIAALMLLIFVLSPAGCNQEKKHSEKTGKKAKIQFENTVYDFGTISYESDGRCYFPFRNDSEEPLIVNVVRTTCGCTRPEWPKDPVEPGGSGRIGITYNTQLAGRFQKSITVYSNAENSPVKLFIKGNVEPFKTE